MGTQDEVITGLNPTSSVDGKAAPNTEEFPSLCQVFSELAPSPAALPEWTGSLSAEEQKFLFCCLQEALKKAELIGESSDVTEELPLAVAFEEIQNLLSKLWECRSHYLVQTAELLANGSRISSCRLSYGRSGVLGFFLRLIASGEATENDLIFHSLRLVGNSCADTDENRTIVVKDNYTSAIIRLFLNPELIKVVTPVIYNLCIDYEPAQSQLAENRIVYILLKLLHENAFKGNEALFDFVYELIELLPEQQHGVENSPDGTISLLIELSLNPAVSEPSQFSCLAHCLMTYLENSRFQELCISKHMVEDVILVLKRSVFMGKDQQNGSTPALAQLQLKINQALSEISSAQLFAEAYPLNSTLTNTLKSLLETPEAQFLICSCVMLGNMARSDEVCEKMIRYLKIHEVLIAILINDTRGSVLHSALGFLKNLAISGNNKHDLGAGGIIPAISHLWGFESVPQVQFAATSIARQLILSSVENISRMLETIPDESIPDSECTYLSLLLSLFEKTDSPPIKTEIGRIVASMCRTLIPKSRDGDGVAENLLGHLFGLHKNVAHPVGAMIIQSQWPVVRSEGWFALALMASSNLGAEVAVNCLEKLDLFSRVEKSLNLETSQEEEAANRSQVTKDRDNIIVLCQELLRVNPDALSEPRKELLQNIMTEKVSQYLITTKQTR